MMDPYNGFTGAESNNKHDLIVPVCPHRKAHISGNSLVPGKPRGLVNLK